MAWIKNGKEKIFSTTYYEYSSKNILSREQVFYEDGGSCLTKYIRKYSPRYSEIVEYSDSSVIKKTVFKYNLSGQKIKKEIYKKAGLEQSIEYFYDSPLKAKGRILKDIEIYIDSNGNGQYETKYHWTTNGKLDYKRIKYYKKSELKSDKTHYYKNYVDSIVTQEIIEGYDPPTVTTELDGTIVKVTKCKPYRETIVKVLNNKKDILKYTYTRDNINTKTGKILPSNKLSSRQSMSSDEFSKMLKAHQFRLYECKYRYNQKNDWTELLFSADDNNYLIMREIKYLK